jgi:thiol-disulfide isomerase/thioredoxin
MGFRIRAHCILTLLAAWMAPAAAPLKPVDEAGYRTLIKAQAGKPVMVDFWATWCVPCRKEMPWLASLSAKYQAKGLVFLTVSADEPEQEAEAARFLERSKVAGQGYIRRAKDDDAFIRSVDAKWSGALPALFLYDRSGKLVKSFVGESDPKAIEAAVARLAP